MKQCPVCNTTYTDETLRYCLADGTVLLDDVSNDSTIVNHDAMRIDINSPSDPTIVPPTHPDERRSESSSGIFLKIFLVIAAFVVLGIIVVAAAAVMLYYNRAPADTPVAVKNAPTKATPTPAASNDDNELREQIANLEKLLNEQTKNNRPANLSLDLPDQTTTVTEARVNSPGDGFLALRTFPSSDTGARILQIPHGATVSVGGCLSGNRVKNKAGRWCRASYNGYTGWVFDAYLIY